MKKFLIIILLLNHLGLNAQTIEKDQALEDLEYLKKSILSFEPALQIYHPEFDSLATQIIDNVNRDTTTFYQHFTKISRISALANEGHLKVGDVDDHYYRGIIENRYSYLPIQVKIISGQIFVYGDFSNEQLLNRGNKIIAINGIQSKDILNKLLAITPSDGDILTYAYRIIEDKFSLLFHFHIQESNTFTLSFIDNNNEETTITLKALARSEQIENIKKIYPEKDIQKTGTKSFYTLTLNDNYAYLKLPSFDYRKINKYNVESKKLYKAIFQELQNKNVKNLIVDLRDNTGGRNEFADDIISFIIQDDNNDAFLKKTIAWNGKTKTYKLPKASKLSFQGSIYVLVNGKTFSAGSTLARYLKEYGNAICIGTETGTRYEGFAAGSSEIVVLPNSKVTIGIPRYHIVFPKSTKQQTTNRGLIPDYEIQSTIETYSNKVDLHLDKAISLLKKRVDE